MNKKHLLIAALATILSVSAANATDITGAEFQNGIYNINPEKINGNVGYRHYANFDLSQGDVAKLIYQGVKSGEIRDLSTFVNLVNNQVKIDGVLNAVKADGTGHAIFITPQGMTVGSHGVLNVGTLSVITPKADAFSALEADYAKDNFTNINQINKMRNGDNRVPAINNYGGNAPVSINGYVFTRNGADIRGSQVDIAGGIVNGYNKNNDFTASNFDGKASAAALFNSLVNTSDLYTRASNSNSSIVIKSGAGVDNYINLTGNVTNLAKGETVLTNHGDQGLNIAGGQVQGINKINLYNNNTASNLTITENAAKTSGADVYSVSDSVSVTSKGGINVTSGIGVQNITAAKDIEIVNKGGKLAFAGVAQAGDNIEIVNSGSQGAEIGGQFNITPNYGKTIRIVNENGKLKFTGVANATESVSIRNQATANGLEVGGSIVAGEGVLVQNKAGDALLNGSIKVNGSKVDAHGNENTAIAIYNEGNGELSTSAASSITAEDGNIAIKNDGANGMALAGTINNKGGETAINNNAGSMSVNGTISNVGNIGVINRGQGDMIVNANIENAGKLKLANVNGNSFEINGDVTNNNGNFSVYNDNGELEINGDLTNSDGYLYIYSRKASDGVTTSAASTIKNTNGNIAIKHNGSGTNAMNRGIDLNGEIIKDGVNGEVAINNYNGDTNIGGTIATNAKTGIINRNGSQDMTVDATITSTNNKELRIKNEAGTGNMEVAGTINHNGRLNVLANEGTLTLSGKVNNSGSDRTYAIARTQADGIEVTKDFNAQSTNGMIYILNKVGQDGLKYQGTIKATNAQAELYNMQGDMTVDGGSIEGNPTIILNKGNKLTVTNNASATGNYVRIVNKGTQAAEIGSNHKANFREELKK